MMIVCPYTSLFLFFVKMIKSDFLLAFFYFLHVLKVTQIMFFLVASE